MNRRQSASLLVMVFAVTGLFTALYINTLTSPEEMIDLLFANGSHISAEGPKSWTLSQENVTYGTGLVGDTTLEMIGDLNNIKERGGAEFGFRIYWNGTIPHERIYFTIALRFPVLYSEKEFDFRVGFTVTMTHNATFDYHFGASVNQLIFYSERVVWPFEIFGTSDGVQRLELSTDYLDNDSYRLITDGIMNPMLTLNLPLKQGFITEVLLDYAAIEVWNQLQVPGNS